MPANHTTPHTEATKLKMSLARKGKRAHQREIHIIEGIDYFRCGTCKQFLVEQAFYRSNRCAIGIKSQCRACHLRSAMNSRSRENSLFHSRVSEANRRARKAGADGKIPAVEMQEIESRFGQCCVRCGATRALTWDHIQPLSRGGDHSIDNLQRMCNHCNNTKHTSTVDYRSDEQKVWVVSFKRI